MKMNKTERKTKEISENLHTEHVMDLRQIRSINALVVQFTFTNTNSICTQTLDETTLNVFRITLNYCSEPLFL